MKKKQINFYTGCLLGGAIGDALGAPIEFMKINEIRSKYGNTGVTDYVEFANNTGEFTDDTQMTLFTAEALLRAHHRAMLKGITGALNSIAFQSYQRWLFTQNNKFTQDSLRNNDGWLLKEAELYKKRAPGITCMGALAGGVAGTIDEPINDSKGCGTIMRMAPVGLMFYGDNQQAFEVGCDLAAITHGHPTGYLSAGFFAAMIADLAVGESLQNAMTNATQILKKWDGHKETLDAVDKAIALYKKAKSNSVALNPETYEQLGSGWIAEEALSLSVFASLVFENNFEKGVLFAVNHSGDCDSTGSITGNILGLINGIEQLPQKWITNLKANELVKQVAEDLHVRVLGNSEYEDMEWWRKYPGG